jgi:cell fate regulator YaaT (PSP1 superfamily)
MGCTGCSTGGCNKLNVVHDWLDNMLPPNTGENENIYEVRFKTTRKGFFKNVNGYDVDTGDYVVVESDRGFDIGMISMGGELARLQMKKKRIDPKYALAILRVANAQETQRMEELRQLEKEYLVRTRSIIYTLKMDMKLSDIEFQGDGTKAIFYYTAEHRVDFRDLIKVLANEFRVRIEMRQIGLRQESGMIGGLGSCGRELCCSSWLTDFKSVTTNAARYQSISLNPAKITGMCGRLKCCLNYELETYLDALKDIPDVKHIETELGVAYLQKTDIFKGTMWFSYGGESSWTPLDVATVQELQRQNKSGIKPPSLVSVDEQELTGRPNSGRPRKSKNDFPDFIDVVGQSTLHERMDNTKKKKRSSSGNHNNNSNPSNNPNQNRNKNYKPNNRPKKNE